MRVHIHIAFQMYSIGIDTWSQHNAKQELIITEVSTAGTLREAGAVPRRTYRSSWGSGTFHSWT